VTVHYEQFVRERQRALFRFAVVLCGDPVLAEELVQDVLARAYERWHLVAAAADANAYVRRMVVNQFLTWKRRTERSSPAKQRAALVLRYYAGLSFAEIAATLGCRESSARGHVTRALSALRIQMTAPAPALDRES
jgi:DNA-directed RNA polymerase specialized sigma24 family protein